MKLPSKTITFLAGFGAAVIIIISLKDNSTFRAFFAWPNGSTWSNTIAWLEDAAIAAFFIWIFRDVVGKWSAAWWQKHHSPHLDAQLDAKLDEKLEVHHQKIIDVMQNGTSPASASQEEGVTQRDHDV